MTANIFLAALLSISLSISLSAGAAPERERHRVVQDSCDLIEVQHVLDGDGRETMAQIIFWDWDARECRYQVRAWRMLKETAKRAEEPRRANWQVRFDWERQKWIAKGDDGEWDREVRADLFRETIDLYDRELEEREVLPKEKRRELSSGKKWEEEGDAPPARVDRDGFPLPVPLPIQVPAWLPWGRGP